MTSLEDSSSPRESSESVVEESIKHQFPIAGCLYLGQMLVGYTLGWTAPITPKLKNMDKTPLTHTLSHSQASWVGSILYFGSISGLIFSAYLCYVVGRKLSLFVGGSFCFLGYLVLGLASNVETIYVGRILTGISNGILIATNLVYIGEIASTHIRGTLLTLTGVFYTMGTLVIYLVGPFVPYKVTCFFAMVKASTYMLLLYFIVPESPVYQVMKGRKDEAKLILKRLGRSRDYDEIIETVAIERPSLKDQLAEMYRTRSNRKALFIILVLNICQQSSGFVAVIFFATTIFDMTGMSMDPHVSTIIVGVTQVTAACITPFFVDRTGRKCLLLVSTAGCSLSLSALGTYFYWNDNKDPIADNFHWLSLSSLILFFLAFNVGFSIIPNTFIGEMFTTGVRSFGSSFSISVGWVFGFVGTTEFGYIVPKFGAYTAFWMYAYACILAFVFTIFFVPETKGKTFLQIQKMLSK